MRNNFCYPLRMVTKSNENLLLASLRARKSNNYLYRDSRKGDNFKEREPSKKKQRTDINKDAKMIRNDNFTRGNREKSNIAIDWNLNDWIAL